MPHILLASASERRRQILSERLEDRDIRLEFYVIREPEQDVSSSMKVNLQVESSCIRKAMAAVKKRLQKEKIWQTLS